MIYSRDTPFWSGTFDFLWVLCLPVYLPVHSHWLRCAQDRRSVEIFAAESCMAVCRSGHPIPDFAFCRRFIESVRMKGSVLGMVLLEVSTLWRGYVKSWISSFYRSVAARTLVWKVLSLRPIFYVAETLTNRPTVLWGSHSCGNGLTYSENVFKLITTKSRVSSGVFWSVLLFRVTVPYLVLTSVWMGFVLSLRTLYSYDHSFDIVSLWFRCSVWL